MPATATVETEGPRPLVTELPHALWGVVDWGSEGDCARPSDRTWERLACRNRETGAEVAVEADGNGRFACRSADPTLASRTARYLAARTGGRVVDDPVEEADEGWSVRDALARTRRIREELTRPELEPLDDLRFWSGWKWVGRRVPGGERPVRWIMDALVRADPAGVAIAIRELRGTDDPARSRALRHALGLLTGDSFKSDRQWLEWWDEAGGRELFPEPDLETWLDAEDDEPSRWRDVLPRLVGVVLLASLALAIPLHLLMHAETTGSAVFWGIVAGGLLLYALTELLPEYARVTARIRQEHDRGDTA